ncbi:hypothetical protein LTR86_005583 [Recurvomyces mirabilis]|nr:hypothetical protein LTR86_005583 [Recurvomyces mirabilis]
MSEPSGIEEQTSQKQNEVVHGVVDPVLKATEGLRHPPAGEGVDDAVTSDTNQDVEKAPATTGVGSTVTRSEAYAKHGAEYVDVEAGKDVKSNTGESRSSEQIQQEASEHLARRASEMHLDEQQANTKIDVEQRVVDKESLPATPPPPPPPTKDKGKAAAEAEPEYDEKHPPIDETSSDVPEAPQGALEPMKLEIQTIMDQFADGNGAAGEEEIMSPRLERQQPILVLPPRTSSLEQNLSPQTTGQSISSQRSMDRNSNQHGNSGTAVHDDNESLISMKSGSLFQPPPPSPEPETSLPFDFHRFLEQLRHRTADPVAGFLRSFLGEFAKKRWMVHEQVKIISDFLEFISKKMAQCEVWRTVSDDEFDNAKEGMEKLVMNRLYSQTFSPAIPSAPGSPRKSKSARSQADAANPHGPGRRGQHQEDVERDEVIAQKIRIYGWISEEHLDIKPIGDKGKKFLGLAQQELLKINSYRAPRDKVICVLNCCKVIFGFLKSAKADQSADAFIPLLIYTVLRARPESLVSNVQYIWRFRNQDKLGGEAGYYMSSLMGVVTFIENLDRTTITISDEEFERNVEHAVSAIAEENKEQEYEEKSHAASLRALQHLSEKSALSRAEVTPNNSMDAEQSSPRRNGDQRLSERSQPAPQSPVSEDDDLDAVSGLLRTIQKPLSSIGRIFSDDSGQSQATLKPASTSQPGSSPRRLSPAPELPRRPSTEHATRSSSRQPGQQRILQDPAVQQANAEAAEAQRDPS